MPQLVLHDCRYEDLSWHHEPQAIAHLSKDVGKAHAQASIRSALWSNLFHSVNGSLFAQPEAAGVSGRLEPRRQCYVTPLAWVSCLM